MRPIVPLEEQLKDDPTLAELIEERKKNPPTTRFGTLKGENPTTGASVKFDEEEE